jgi:hypothetical protein
MHSLSLFVQEGRSAINVPHLYERIDGAATLLDEQGVPH